MTVTYTKEVATQKLLGVFWKLLFRWRGSLYKAIWPELLLYGVLYYAVRFTYSHALDEDKKRTFEKVALHFQEFTDLIPVSFILGFYVSIVMSRWWSQYNEIPWCSSLAIFVTNTIIGNDERGRLMRRTIMRYVNLAYVITLTMISPTVKKRFPTMDHLIEAGFLNPNEKTIFENMDLVSNHPKYWMPFVWANAIVSRARREGRIRDDFSVRTVADSLNNFRMGIRRLLTYDQISLPLVYTQVVTLAVYSFFFSTLIGRQFLDPNQKYPKNYADYYVPWFTLLQFLFYMGWLKVAETLLNPFGEDDDDFNMNSMVDFNLQISYLIVDEMHNDYPELVKDTYWDDVIPQELPYTQATQHLKIEPPQGSASDIVVPEEEQEFIWPTTVTETNEEQEEQEEEKEREEEEKDNDDDVMSESVNEPKNKNIGESKNKSQTESSRSDSQKSSKLKGSGYF